MVQIYRNDYCQENDELIIYLDSNEAVEKQKNS